MVKKKKKNYVNPPTIDMELNFFSERRRGRKEKLIWGEKWRREKSCTKRQLKDCKSRWEETSQSCMDLLYWASHFSVAIDSHCLSQIAQLERKEPERKNHSVDASVTRKQLNSCDCRLYDFDFVSLLAGKKFITIHFLSYFYGFSAGRIKIWCRFNNIVEVRKKLCLCLRSRLVYSSS